MSKPINILITSCGRRVELVKAFKNARDILNIEGNIICADASLDAPALYFSDKRYKIPRVSDESFIGKIIEICKEENVSLLVPTIDTELLKLAENAEKIEKETNAKVLISDLECISICRDKIKTVDFFKANGFAIPYTYSEEELKNKKVVFPLFIKPKNGSSSVNAFKVENMEELNFFLNYVPQPIVQELINGTEYTVDVFIDFEGELVSCLPRKRLATRSGEILKGQIDQNITIIEDVKKMIGCLNFVGHITVQGFLGEDNVFRYIEINPRFGGGAPMAIKAGADSCQWLFKLLKGEKIKQSDIVIKNNIVFSRFDDSLELV